jgi:hypothetical protein
MSDNRSSLLINTTILFLGLWLCGCSFLVGNDTESKSRTYSYKAPIGWTQLPAGGSDHAYSNPRTNSIMTVNSLCGRYQTTTLRQLTNNILGGLDRSTIEQSETKTYAGREALRTLAHARMDGVPVHLIIKTVRKNECIYDFILISSSKEIREADSKYFDRLLEQTTIP